LAYHSVSAALSQVQDSPEVVVVYVSKVLSAAEQKYCTTRKMLMAVIKAVRHFHLICMKECSVYKSTMPL